MHYITHITLTTGHIARQQRGDVPDAALAALLPWLAGALSSGHPTPLPWLPGGYSALALQQDGALVVTVYGPDPDTGQPEPLTTFGVAPRSRSAAPLWDMLMRTQPYVIAGLSMPGAPWCAVAPYPTLVAHPDAIEWLGDFERCAAWAWASRHPGLRAV
ncbi:hypothetical protein [Xanthomonas translucens]|uniref:hypothetical protein n=1 Tax=Xanthomonas campestris pv. translucens TaxID=343 RepID=UPI001F6197F1|nr:hypothetical protein [Xanthomonas translucens]UNU01215.1 hypothetical protein KBQ49_20150 [Xanthomonas translucens pv. translucens]